MVAELVGLSKQAAMTKGGLRKIVLEAIDKQYLKKSARGIDTKANAVAAMKGLHDDFDTVWKNSFSTYPWMPELWAKHLQQMTDRRVEGSTATARSASDRGMGSRAAPPSVSAVDGGEDDDKVDAALPPWICKVVSRQRDMRQLYFLTKAEELRSSGEFFELLTLPGFKMEEATQFLAMTHLGRREMQSAQTTLQHMTTKEERDAFFAGDDAALKEAQDETQRRNAEYAKLKQETETANALAAAEATRMANELEAVKLEAKTKSEEAAEKLRGAEEQIAKLSSELKAVVAAQEEQAQTTLHEVRAEAAAKLKEAGEQITKLNAQVADETSAAQEAAVKLKEAGEQITKLNAQVADETSAAQEAAVKLKEAGEQITKLNAQVADETSAAQEAAVKLMASGDEIAKLRAQIGAMTAEAESFQQREADMQNKLATTTTELERRRMGAEDTAERDGKLQKVESELQAARDENVTARQLLEKCQKDLEKETAAKTSRRR
eukprot:TRINITY_DN11691_c0_g1_i7.p1 TRINITY_DN11691_c0_g1~~TRINITY_DN11691_c0_g1_i7.p1  ORF type:complete len:514 (+),score=161.34 TRINITY_DN11691_c0_g1_i7:61-1542(+)